MSKALNSTLNVIPAPVLLGGGLIVCAVLYVYLRGIKGAAADAVNGAASVAAGGIVGVGQIVGIPDTNLNACELAIKEGRTLDASFACPLPRFTQYLTTGK